MAKILVIDDDRHILNLVQTALSRDHHQVVARDNAVDVQLRHLKNVDLILLDVMMPGVDGFSLCKGIRQEVDCPILFLTAKTMAEDVVEGLALGADDYIKKPFNISELRARVQAHLRREKREKKQRLVLDGVSLNLMEKTLRLGEMDLNLTKTEYEICELLARHRGQVFSLEHILEQVIGYESESDDNVIRVHVKNIRKKFAEHGHCPIETVWGVGYKWQ
ncbi:MAG: response regulator transcription factor [Eubacteriaceae bacterium]|jgi:DNA-binding response OmpR family regulator|nr:response regulator transcription factor [Eubacteriaceae bacterium]